MRFDADLTELDFLAEGLDLGRFIAPHEIPYFGESGAERAARRERFRRRLHRDGRLSRHGGLRADFEELLRVWAEPEVVLTQVVNVVEADRRLSYRGGWRGRTGVLTSQKGTVLTFDELRPAQVVDKLMGFLPDWEPVHGAPVTYVESRDARPSGTDHGEDFFGGIDAVPANPSGGPRATERFFAAPVVRAGAITCSVREPGSRTRRGREVEVGSLTWFDTTGGRFFLTTETLSDGAERHTLTPADRARIAQWLRDRLNR
ncbi:ESX secretion-associated protein EspG [Amycolatopsis cynarae]|uniref:ESX secretion-associated protein EspG n=1 Tax=Amycolatopsis cynarae TaxID=2995223 RepID=A0ABY7B798_9PSEU|nr:ESX secretion-associated protein EspG [Amycolatopsis sp. HUAS 11-8]WAL67063.1 ESX secretion-associated protein EspG [Amycolatopsis sp. HUAS 11-8]